MGTNNCKKGGWGLRPPLIYRDYYAVTKIVKLAGLHSSNLISPEFPSPRNLMVAYPLSHPTEPPRSPRETLPTMYDLPSEDPEEPGLPDEFHDLQPQLLSRTLRSPKHNPQKMFTGSDLNLYYDVRHPQWHKRPDWFLVVGVPRLYDEIDLRSSYVIWQEGLAPLVVVELLSPGTEKEDLGDYAEGEAGLVAATADEVDRLEPASEPELTNGQTAKEKPPGKWQVYEQILRVPYYVVFSRYTDRLQFFQLMGGHYQEQLLDPSQPCAWIPELELGIGVWRGEFEQRNRAWLRWCDDRGNWIPTDTEQERQRADQERQRADQESQRANQAELQLQQIAIGLLQTGMPIAQVVNLTQLSEAQIRKLADDRQTSQNPPDNN
jgi:Uma2 family endonuclease